MATTWIVKLPRSENDEQPILLHVSQKKNHGLDLDLLATEGEAVYKGKVRERKLKDLRSNRDISDDDFATILRYALISKFESKISRSQKNSLEVVASVSGKGSSKALTITFRNRIDGITQRLGSIDLLEDEEEISLFDWTAIAVDKQSSAEKELASLKDRTESDRETIASLQEQIATLIQAKEEHEEQMLSKFVLLLNEKKLKIRNQQRIMSTAKVDKKKLKALQSTLEGEPTTRRTTRSSKRAAEDDAGQRDDSDSSNAFEEAAAGPATRHRDRRGSSRATTPETETASEDEEMADSTAAPPAADTRTNAASPLPEPRKLPFIKKGEKPTGSKPAEAGVPASSLDSDEETASEDDEL